MNRLLLLTVLLFTIVTVSQEKYIFEIDTTGDEDIFTVTSPLHLLEEPYTESRFGVFTFEDGSIYEGKVKKNKIHGIGKYTDAQGEVYEGKFTYGTLKNKIEAVTARHKSIQRNAMN